MPLERETKDYFPANSWRTSTPEAQGMDSEYLVKMLSEIQANDLNVHSALIIRRGHLVMEAYAEPFRKDKIHVICSNTKSVTSAVVGIAIKEGYIKTIDQKVVDFFPDLDIKNLDGNKKSITIRHLLTMSSGIDWTDFPNDIYPKSQNWTQSYLDLPMNKKAGESFNYDSAGVNLLLAIVRKTSGMKISEFAEKFLFHPIGITDYFWATDPQGINLGGWGLALTPMEMARFGYLYLNKGKWNGNQIIPAGWVEASMSKQIDAGISSYTISTDKGYGYLWWGLPFGGFTAHGYGGQFIMVMPEKDMVVIFTSGFSTKEWKTPLRLTEDFILKSIVSDNAIPESSGDQTKLAAAIQEFANPANHLEFVVPETARKISGKSFILDPNPWNMKAVMLTFHGTNECIFGEEWPNDPRPHFKALVGLDGKYRENTFVPDSHQRHFRRGKWIDENTFFVESFRPWDNSSKILYTFRFDGDMLKLTVNSSVGEWSQEFTARIENT